MTAKSTGFDADLHAYMLANTLREPDILRELRLETAAMPRAAMQIGPEQGQFMQLLARLTGVQRYLEIGVFTGYSSLAMALAMPEDGEIIACDVSDEFTRIARRYWRRAEVQSKIDLRLAPAIETLDALITEGAEHFDCAFIDADKGNVDGYYERALTLLRPNALLLVDNVLWGGTVADASVQDDDTRALRALVSKAGRDERVDVSMLALCDGLLLVRKR